MPAEVEAMLGSLALYQDQITRERHAPDRRLVTVLGSLASGVVLVTDQGQVSLLNNTARELLGAERARVGTSLFAALSRESVLAAMERARKAGRILETLFERLDGATLQGRIVLLPDDEGAVIIFPPVELDRHRPGVEFDLQLHDVPPVGRTAEPEPAARGPAGRSSSTPKPPVSTRSTTASSRWARSAHTAPGCSRAA